MDLYPSDILAAATLLSRSRLALRLYEECLALLRKRGPTLGGASGARAAILTPRLAVATNAWGLFGPAGDRELTDDDLRDVELAALEDALAPSSAQLHPMQALLSVQIDRVSAASNDIARRHGAEAVMPFLKACWDGRLLRRDTFFFAAHAAIRAEAFRITPYDSHRELGTASRAAGSAKEITILSRAQALADIDRGRGRVPDDLLRVVRREHDACEVELSSALDLSLEHFLRRVGALAPVYYTLRDLWFEVHFYSDDDSIRAESNEKETLVDERWADSLVLLTCPPAAQPWCRDLPELCGDPKVLRRHLRYWSCSRVQFNQSTVATLQSCLAGQSRQLAAASIDEVTARMLEELSDGQRFAVQASDLFFTKGT